MWDDERKSKEWGTYDQYRWQNPHRESLESAQTSEQRFAAQKDYESWEMNQVAMRKKPAFISGLDSNPSNPDARYAHTSEGMRKFAARHGLHYKLQVRHDNDLGREVHSHILGQTAEDVHRVMHAKSGRELGLALGYTDLNTK